MRAASIMESVYLYIAHEFISEKSPRLFLSCIWNKTDKVTAAVVLRCRWMRIYCNVLLIFRQGSLLCFANVFIEKEVNKTDIAIRGNHHTAEGNHMPYGITHPAAVTFPPLPQPKLVLDLASPEGCKLQV